MESAQSLGSFLQFVLARLVREPERATLSWEQDERGDLHFLARLAPRDVGMLIGRGGCTIMAVRGMLSAGAARHNVRAWFEAESTEEEGKDYAESLGAPEGAAPRDDPETPAT